jgi:DsbC/DsbD-like thiol-disulfide interchange protein
MFIFITMKKIMILLVLLFNIAGSSVFSQSPIIGLKSVDIIRGWRQSDDIHIAAINIKLEDGWKTYWRVPGIGGIAPILNWEKSKNIKNISQIWPTPNIYNEYGLQTIGYKDELLLPLQIQPIDKKQPIHLSITIDFGICSDVCVPIQTAVEERLPERTSIGKKNILDTLEKAILSGNKSPFKIVKCNIVPIKDGFEVNAFFEGLTSFDKDTLGVVEYPVKQNGWINQKASLVSGNQLNVHATVYNKSIHFIDRSDLTLTIFTKNKAFEFGGCIS